MELIGSQGMYCNGKEWTVLLTGRRGCTSCCGASSASTAATGMHRGEPTNKAQPKQFYIEAYYAKMWDKQYSRMHKGGPTRQDNQNSRLSHFMQNCIPQGCLLYSTAARNRSPQKIKCLKGHKSLGSLFEGVLVISFSLTLSLQSLCCSGHVSSSLWSDVLKVTSLLEC